MIFFFSGTGNSLWVAKKIAEYNGDNLISIADCMNRGEGTFEFTLKEEELIGFVYPIYAWGPPKMVRQFIAKLKLNNYKNNYTFSTATCGDNIGNAMKLFDKWLVKRNMHLDSAFSVQMPNNYIVSFDVD